MTCVKIKHSLTGSVLKTLTVVFLEVTILLFKICQCSAQAPRNNIVISRLQHKTYVVGLHCGKRYFGPMEVRRQKKGWLENLVRAISRDETLFIKTKFPSQKKKQTQKNKNKTPPHLREDNLLKN